MYHYYVKQNPTELYYERHRLLVGHARSASFSRKAQHPKKKAQVRRKSRTVRAALGLFVAALMMVGLVLLGASGPARASTTFTVNSTGDFPDAFLGDTENVCDADIFLNGAQCTLRAAIQEANHTPGADAIQFDIPATGVQTIKPTSELPAITDAVTIDGYTQPGASPNTLARGTNAKIMIELSGPIGETEDGLTVQASNTVVRGLTINRFASSGIVVSSGVGGVESTGVKIEGNFIGTDPLGTLDLGNADLGVILGSAQTTVGGATPEARNLISGNDLGGLLISHPGGNKVLGNLIGTKKDGKSALGNLRFGGISMANGAANNLVGGSTAATANTIAFNEGAGVEISNFESPTSNRILNNSIFSNGALGIDLGGQGPTENDGGIANDADTGANNLQNFPVLGKATTTADGKTIIKGTLDSAPNKTYVIRFFSNPSNQTEGKTFLGKTKVTSGADGVVGYSFSPARAVSAGKTITATATDNAGSTSEFSEPKTVVRI